MRPSRPLGVQVQKKHYGGQAALLDPASRKFNVDLAFMRSKELPSRSSMLFSEIGKREIGAG
jgi:hypothetical protein